MTEAPVELLVAAFRDEDGADKALKELQEAKRARWISITNAAVIRRDTADKLHIKETADKGFGKGAVIGGVVGAVLGVVFPPTILASAALGAGLGGVAAKVTDGGFPDARLRELGESLKPGTSLIVAVIEHKWVVEAQQQLAEMGAQVVVESLKADIAEQLGAGREVSYSVVEDDQGMSLQRAAVGEGHVELSEIAATSEGVAGVSVVADENAPSGTEATDAESAKALGDSATAEKKSGGGEPPTTGEAPAGA